MHFLNSRWESPEPLWTLSGDWVHMRGLWNWANKQHKKWMCVCVCVCVCVYVCVLLYENSAPCGWWFCTAPVSILPSTAAGPSSTRLLICRNSSGSSPPTTVKPKPRRLFFSFVLMKVPLSSAGFLVKKGFPPAECRRNNSKPCVQSHILHWTFLNSLRHGGYFFSKIRIIL